jgi:DNA-binding phage protein
METLNKFHKKVLAHWTEQSSADFVYRMSFDFVAQIEKKLEKDQIKYSEFAEKCGVSPARISQIMNDPGNLELATTVQCVRALGMKVALVAYDDGDAKNETGPVNSEIFSACWQRAGCPRDFFDLSVTIQDLTPYPTSAENLGFLRGTAPFVEKTAAASAPMRIN